MQNAPPQTHIGQMVRKAHATYLTALREDRNFVGFQETRTRTIRGHGIQALRSDYTRKIAHPIDFLSMPL
ncbi:MAG: hypothetical protein C4337_10445 [Armatimonadota bacterium]